MKLYTKKHEWIDADGDEARFGLTEYAAEKLGVITFVDLPEVGESYSQNELLCSIEGVSKQRRIFMPVSGEIVDLNEDLGDEPEKITNSPEDEGWIAAIAISRRMELDDLMDEDEYRSFVKD